MTIDEKIIKRSFAIQNWLQQNHPECKIEQAHLDKDTPERAYWHYGYNAALKDIISLFEKELQKPF
ncbi:MAG: hypothetical protein DWP97_07815 [Calditrichaeota bacterium]|nr:MAG: hypothetical protein DWP97_07815 [Calditrichota bacterium]